MGGTRGRLYIKHPHLFKYAADPQDKHWLAEQQHMRATGGKMAGRPEAEVLPGGRGAYKKYVRETYAKQAKSQET
ncbi:hypothetical protein llap_16215 [Limosa lapponica baueri]|uniref:TdIF1 C-terminal domain-containing protein n=1 Tax=Limosa lapponica baueri TaxID=1758121 RepID=A0A2I0TI84_LIMLA|nr:hypothetical protein llap_16215 [Limosa lapponica baueri]